MSIGARAIEAPLKDQLSTDFLANNILAVEKKKNSSSRYIPQQHRRIKTRKVTTEFMQVCICTRTLQSVCLRTKRQQKMGFSSRRQSRMPLVSQKNWKNNAC
ncbi:hypothetical protein TNIN_183361 [Trichonephila inaurata madagascariensis]|uniref:Uncharacterized protein n=1 Tax=Trichonephila inaurata madagascariensis TaxID=2747483 RepID=A0A8X6MJF9_9ARAC|nr:hypothetical protein TNIN_183361 [Trichonephila inaurata madagascariensis]